MNLRSFWQIIIIKGFHDYHDTDKLTINQSLYVEKMSGLMSKNGGFLVAFMK